MSEVGNFSIHGSVRSLVLASALVKEKYPDFIGLRGMTISKVVCVLSRGSALLGREYRVHVEFKVVSFERVIYACV